MNLKKTTFIIALAAAVAGGGPARTSASTEGSRGVGTWDSRSGSESIGSNSLLNSKVSGRDNKAFVERHIMWRWKRHFFIDFNPKKHKTIERGMVVLAQPDWDENDPFWKDLWNLKEVKDPVWTDLVEALRTSAPHASLWKIRAYQDKDDQGKDYMALELSACLHFAHGDAQTEKERADTVTKLKDYMRDKPTITTEREPALREELAKMKIEEITQLEAWLFSKH